MNRAAAAWAGWGTVVATVENMGLERMIKIRQNQYDRIMGR